MRNLVGILGGAICLMLVSSQLHAVENCGDVFNGSADAKDYADPKYFVNGLVGQKSTGDLYKVERRHFNKNVESLRRGVSSRDPYPDLLYTLSHFPNHYRALMTLVRYDELKGGKLPNSARYAFTQSVDCYFKRAIQFRPADTKVLHLYGIYYYKKEDYQEAINYFEMANQYGNSAELVYNIGLAYFEMGKLDKAKEYAQQAYDNKFPLPGLKNKLKEKGIELEIQ